MVSEGVMVSIVHTFTRLAVLASLTGSAADGSALPETEKRFAGPPRREREVNWQQQINTSALNTALAFVPYHDLATRTTGPPGVPQQQQQQQERRQQQHNILFSPLGLASALALLSQVSGSESQSQALGALGLAANSTEQSVEATISALADLLHNLTLQEGGVGSEVQRAESEAGAGTRVGIGATEGAKTGGADVENAADVEDGAEGRGGNEDGVHAGGQLRVWSGLRAGGERSLDYESFLSGNLSAGPSAFNVNLETLVKDSSASDKLELDNYVYFKDRLPFERLHTVPRRFQLNATASVDVAMMFRDDSSEVMMLYDTNCSATVVRLAQSERLATLLLLPKAELQPLEECLSDGRMSFWLSNLKPGRAEILFPKFQLRKSYSLESLLRSSGITSIFSQSADFSGISRGRTLRLVKASHEAMLRVEETRLEDRGHHDVPLDFSVPPRITFNRPFMLVIYDNLTRLIVLMGRIINPTNI